MELPCDLAIPLLGVYTSLCANFHSSIIHNSQKVETAQMSLMDRYVKYGISVQWNIIHNERNEILIYVTTWGTLKTLFK